MGNVEGCVGCSDDATDDDFPSPSHQLMDPLSEETCQGPSSPHAVHANVGVRHRGVAQRLAPTSEPKAPPKCASPASLGDESPACIRRSFSQQQKSVVSLSTSQSAFRPASPAGGESTSPPGVAPRTRSQTLQWHSPQFRSSSPAQSERALRSTSQPVHAQVAGWTGSTPSMSSLASAPRKQAWQSVLQQSALTRSCAATTAWPTASATLSVQMRAPTPPPVCISASVTSIDVSSRGLAASTTQQLEVAATPPPVTTATCLPFASEFVAAAAPSSVIERAVVSSQIGTTESKLAHVREVEKRNSGSQLVGLPSPRQWGWVDSQLLGWREDDDSGKQPDWAKCVNLATLVRKAESVRQRGGSRDVSKSRAVSEERKALARRLLREGTI